MTPEEKRQLETIVMTLADPKGNWSYYWRMLCEMAGLDPDKHQAPFKPNPFDEPRDAKTR